MTNLRFVYITAKDASEARRIGTILVEERLAACVNIVGNIASIYRWEGRIQEGNEAVIFAKTTEGNVERLIERTGLLSEYDCPCILTLPVLEGHPAYTAWVREECPPGSATQ